MQSLIDFHSIYFVILSSLFQTFCKKYLLLELINLVLLNCYRIIEVRALCFQGPRISKITVHLQKYMLDCHIVWKNTCQLLKMRAISQAAFDLLVLKYWRSSSYSSFAANKITVQKYNKYTYIAT